ncbi:EMBRYO DEFECTIVE 3135 [Hibiscus trionum]|uniref:EMBRYO DEFECTIVE 3135 n=1 Tax=Hibiscus trionum TaxID=183268 RepID=A0A9W7M5D1_HIBTR|nr:EMBRYO DEFECTIVE 3135 [Hibiscus trionum]
MSDKVPPSKPTVTAAAPPAANGSSGGAAATKTAITNGGTKAAHLYNPTSRPPYSRQPYNRRHHNRPRRSYCCCFCCWSILVILVLVLLGAITSTVLYVLFRPDRPSFTLASLRIHRLNLTTAADSSSSHLSTLFNLTLSSKNPNSYLSFSYDPFVVSCVSSNSDVFLGNGALPAFVSESKNDTTFKGVVVATSSDLDVDTVKSLRPDLKKKNGVSLKVEMDTRVMVKMGGSKSKKVGIRVTCDGIKGAIPRGKSPSLANVSAAKCKVDLRIKIWRWTF